ADGADAVVGDAVAAMAVQVVIPGDRDAVVRVDRDGRGVVDATVAPGVVRIGVDRAHAVLAHAHVGGAAAAAGLVDQLVAVAAVAGGQGHGALEQAVADAFGRDRVAATALVAARLGGMHFIPLGQDRAVAGIDDVTHLGRGLVGTDAGHGDLVGEHRLRAARVRDQLRARGRVERRGEVAAGRGDRPAAADAGRRARARLGARGRAGSGDLAVA